MSRTRARELKGVSISDIKRALDKAGVKYEISSKKRPAWLLLREAIERCRIRQ